MITLTSSTQPPQELAEALAAHGITPDAPAVEAKPAEPVKAEEKPPVQPAEPGGETPKVAGSETVPAPEAGKESTQVTQDPAEPEPSRGKFKAEKQKLRDQIYRLSEDLDLERGGKVKLAQQLEEAKAKLAALTKPAEPVKDDTPTEPKLPTLAEHEFDQEKFDAAMVKYQGDFKTYLLAMQKQAVTEALEKRDKDDREKSDKAAADKIFADFNERKAEGIKEIPDYEELMASVEDIALPEFVELAIIHSDVPAHMLHFLFKDKAEKNGAELARIARLDPLLQVRELGKLEARLAMEREQAKKKAAAPVVDQAVTQDQPPKAPEPPAKPVVKAAVPDAPIEPVGSRTNGRNPRLSDAKSPREYMELKAQGAK